MHIPKSGVHFWDKHSPPHTMSSIHLFLCPAALGVLVSSRRSKAIHLPPLSPRSAAPLAPLYRELPGKRGRSARRLHHALNVTRSSANEAQSCRCAGRSPARPAPLAPRECAAIGSPIACLIEPLIDSGRHQTQSIRTFRDESNGPNTAMKLETTSSTRETAPIQQQD